MWSRVGFISPSNNQSFFTLCTLCHSHFSLQINDKLKVEKLYQLAKSDSNAASGAAPL